MEPIVPERVACRSDFHQLCPGHLPLLTRKLAQGGGRSSRSGFRRSKLLKPARKGEERD